MRRPRMILFDYGHTLVHEPGFDGVRGTEAVLRHAVRNPRGCTAEEVGAFANSLYGRAGAVRELGYEVHNLIMERFMYEYLQIEFDIPPSEVERIFWDNAAPGDPMPYVGEMLAYLREHGIRSGVISNIGFSGAALENRLKRILPDHKFEFVIASSEYAFRKPEKMIFELALRKADLPGEDVWFCGDSTKFDVAGAAGVGVFPVWYHSHLECFYRDKSLDVRPDIEHLYIRDWRELTGVLERGECG